jgi:O-antigen ligase
MVLLPALILSGSRGSLVSAGLAVVVLLAIPAGQKVVIAWIWGASFALTSLLLVRPSSLDFLPAFFSRVRQNSDFTSGRLDIYRQLIVQWQDSPVLGTGYRSAEVQLAHNVSAAGHNTYLSLLVELGVVGFAVFAGLLVVTFLAAKRDELLIGAVVAVLAIELTESTLFGFGGPTALFSWLILFGYAATGARPDGNGRTA